MERARINMVISRSACPLWFALCATAMWNHRVRAGMNSRHRTRVAQEDRSRSRALFRSGILGPGSDSNRSLPASRKKAEIQSLRGAVTCYLLPATRSMHNSRARDSRMGAFNASFLAAKLRALSRCILRRLSLGSACLATPPMPASG